MRVTRLLPRSGQAERGVAFPPSPRGGERRGFGGRAPISPVRSGCAWTTRGLLFGSLDQEGPLRQMMLMRGQQRLFGGRFASQLVTAHFMAIEVDLAPHQPVLPSGRNEEFVTQEFDLSVLVGLPHVD